LQELTLLGLSVVYLGVAKLPSLNWDPLNQYTGTCNKVYNNSITIFVEAQSK